MFTSTDVKGTSFRSVNMQQKCLLLLHPLKKLLLENLSNFRVPDSYREGIRPSEVIGETKRKRFFLISVLYGVEDSLLDY